MNEEIQVAVIPEEATNSNELEEVYIPQEHNTADDNELDDVIPCEPVSFGEQSLEYEVMDSFNDGFYDEVDSSTPSVSLDQMVDIAPHSVDNANELEEVYIPQEHNTADDNELDDVA